MMQFADKDNGLNWKRLGELTADLTQLGKYATDENRILNLHVDLATCDPQNKLNKSFLMVFADTVEISQDITFNYESVAIVCRQIVIKAKSGKVSLKQKVGSEGGFQVSTRSIVGGKCFVSVARETTGPSLLLAPPSIFFPISYLLSSDSPKQIQETKLIDSIRQTEVQQILGASFVAATALFDSQSMPVRQQAADMLRWVNGWSSLLSKDEFVAKVESGRLRDLSDLQTQSTSLLQLVNLRSVGVKKVPVLSSKFYESEIKSVLAGLVIFNEVSTKLSALKQSENEQRKLIGGFIQAAQNSQKPLLQSLGRLRRDMSGVRDQYINAASYLKLQQDDVKEKKKAFDASVKRFELKTTLMTMFKLGMAFAEAYVSLGASLLKGPDPETMKVVFDAAKVVIETGIESGEKIAIDNTALTAKNEAAVTGIGEKVKLMGYIASAVWSFLDTLPNAPGERPIPLKDIENINPAKLENVLPDSSWLSMDGIDPVAYWDKFKEEAESGLDPAIQDGDAALKTAAGDYLDSLKKMVIFGKSVADKQATMLRLVARALETMGQIKSSAATVVYWEKNKATLLSDESRIAQTRAMVLQHLNDLKRSLIVSVAEYNAAYEYTWQTPSPIQISADMSVPQLHETCAKLGPQLDALITGENDVVSPPQETSHFILTIPVGSGTTNQFSAVKSNDNGIHQQRLRFAISPDSKARVGQLSSVLNAFKEITGEDTAAYVEQFSFFLDGEHVSAGSVSGQISMSAETSGSYTIIQNRITHRYESKPFELDYSYTPPDNMSEFFNHLQPGDENLKAAISFLGGNSIQENTPGTVAKGVEALYLRPALFTEWTLTLNGETPEEALHKAEQVKQVVVVLKLRYLKANRL